MAMMIRNLVVVAAVAVLTLTWNRSVAAHCDTLDGPVVGASRKALESGNINLVLIWIQKKQRFRVTRLTKSGFVFESKGSGLDLTKASSL
jgi:hypothetical protein